MSTQFGSYYQSIQILKELKKDFKERKLLVEMLAVNVAINKLQDAMLEEMGAFEAHYQPMIDANIINN